MAQGMTTRPASTCCLVFPGVPSPLHLLFTFVPPPLRPFFFSLDTNQACRTMDDYNEAVAEMVGNVTYLQSKWKSGPPCCCSVRMDPYSFCLFFLPPLPLSLLFARRCLLGRSRKLLASVLTSVLACHLGWVRTVLETSLRRVATSGRARRWGLSSISVTLPSLPFLSVVSAVALC